MTLRLVIAGEGSNELGEWAKHPSYRQHPPMDGVIEALLYRARRKRDWRVEKALLWKQIPKYRARSSAPMRAEARNILGLALQADEAGCDLVFIRDRDGDEDREEQIAEGIREARCLFSRVQIAGAAVIEDLESWVLACCGELHTEGLRTTKKQLLLSKYGIDPKNTDHMANAVQNANWPPPQDAIALLKWLQEAAAL